MSDAPDPNLVGSIDLPVENRVAKLVNASGQRFETVFEFLGEGIVFQNRQGQIVLANDSASNILGLTHDQLEGRTSTDPRWQALKEDGSPFPGEEHPAMVALETGEPQFNVLMNVLKADGTRTWIKINAIPIFDGDTRGPTSVISSFSDVTNIKSEEQSLRAQLTKLQESQAQIEARRQRLEQANRELRETADIDSDTGLKNRRCFMERLCAEVALASRKQIPLSILIGEILALDDLSESSVQVVTTEALGTAGRILKEACRISDFAARYSNEKFAIIMPHSSIDEASLFAERLVGELANDHLKVCIGVVEYRTGSLTNEFLEQAEEVLFRAKATGLGTCS